MTATITRTTSKGEVVEIEPTGQRYLDSAYYAVTIDGAAYMSRAFMFQSSPGLATGCDMSASPSRWDSRR